MLHYSLAVSWDQELSIIMNENTDLKYLVKVVGILAVLLASLWGAETGVLAGLIV